MEILFGIWTCLLVAWSIIGAYLLREIAQQRRALGAQLALVQVYRHANSSPFDSDAGMIGMQRHDSYFYVGGGKPACDTKVES